MDDLFSREQKIFDDAVADLTEIRNGASVDIDKLETFVKEYGSLLRQLRRIIKISDRTTVDLNASKLDLLDKVHLDALTGIYNRRFMEDNLKRIIKFISRAGGTLSLLMIDVDFFKNYNDTYGHGMGDKCLKLIAGALTRSLTRRDDFVARYGGEEFVAVLPNTNETGACEMSDKILNNIRALNIPHENSAVASHITISIGATSGVVKYTQTGADYLKCADGALYESKQSGRDKYTFRNLTQ